MDVPVEDFPRDILHGWFVMIDQMWTNRLFHHSDMFFYSGSNSSTCCKIRIWHCAKCIIYKAAYLLQTLCRWYTQRNARSGSSLSISVDTKQESSFYLFYNGTRRKWQASLSRNGCYQEWLQTRHHGLQKADWQRTFATLPQSRGRQIETVTAEHYA